MATTSTTTAAATPTIPSDALRLVLFGMPDAGKSSLLGALAQAASMQERLLQGRVFDLPTGLQELRRHVYEDRTRETLDEIVPYSIVYEPFHGTKRDERWSIALIDCDGRVANELLTRRKSFETDAGPGSLADAVLRADALLLVVDASANSEQMETDFREFSRFLKFLHSDRVADRAVGGLPVYLLLAKCDLLAKFDDTPEQWYARVDERKTHVFDRFQDFIASETAAQTDARMGFGSIDLHVAATAVRRPNFHPANVPTGAAGIAEPFGVAEVFQDCFASAKAFHRRDIGSQIRLFWTLLGVFSLVGMMGIFAVLGLMLNKAVEEVALVGKVRNYESREGQTASSRLAEAGLLKRLAELTELSKDPDFARLPKELQDYVQARLDELTTYREYRDRLVAQRSPGRLQSTKDLDQLQSLLGDPRMQLPEKYREQWSQTDAAQLRSKWLKDLKLLQGAVGEISDWYDRLIRRGNALLFVNSLDSTWSQEVAELFRDAESPKYRETDRIGDSVSLPTAEGQGVTYAVAYRFDSIERKQAEWRQSRDRIGQLRDLADALGILGDPRGERAVFAFPPSNRDADILAQARRRYDTLQRLYPDFRQWSISSVPDPVRPEIEKRLQAAYDQLIRDGQILIQRRMQQLNPTGAESHSDWLRLADWLSTPAIQEWRQLLDVVQKLNDPAGGEAVVQLASFLRRPSFDLELREVKVKIPDTLRDTRVIPAGKLLLYTKAPGGQWVTIQLRPADDGQRDRQGYYRFVLEAGDPKPVFKPGDDFTADLAVREGTRELKLSWVNGKSTVYPFQRLRDVPQLHLPTEKPTAGDRATGVVVLVEPMTGLPELPDLLPNLADGR